MKNLAIIPARSGSKGLKDKNIKILDGKPLIAYTIFAAIESGLFDEIMVSTDSLEYSKIALDWGAKVPFLRNEELANDDTSSWDVVKSVLAEYKLIGKEFETIALLQPTSPLRDSKDIINGYNLFNEKNANAVISVCEADHSPLWMNILPNDFSMKGFIKPEIAHLNRQSIPKYYLINGAIYILKTDFLMGNFDLYSNNSYALVMDKLKSIDIDDNIDFIYAKSILNSYQILEQKKE